MRKKLLHNLSLKIISFFLAFLIWFLVTQIGNPPETKAFQDIPVILVNTEVMDQENKVYQILDNSDYVKVTVSAPRKIIENMRSSDIIARADMTKLTDINTIAIELDVQNAEVDYITPDHGSVKLMVEDKASKWVRLSHRTIGEVAEGYMIGSTTLDQTRIEITGPASLIDQVSYAAIEFDITGATTNQSANVEIGLYNKQDQLVADQARLSKNVSYVRISIEVLATKTVPVELQITGQPMEGYAVNGENSASLKEITVAGTATVLSQLSRIVIPDTVLDITGMTESYSSTLNMRDYLPEGVRLAYPDQENRISVTIGIEEIIEKDMILSPDSIVSYGNPEGTNTIAVLEQEPIVVTVQGLKRNLDQVTQRDLKATVDVSAYMEEHQLQAIVNTRNEMQLQVTAPAGVTVISAPVVLMETYDISADT